MVRETRTMAAV